MTLHAERPFRSRFKRGFVASAVGLLISFGMAGHAAAAPSPAEFEAQIDQAWNKLEPTIEERNRVHVELTANKAKADELAAKIKPLQERVDRALNQVSSLSVRQYKGGPVTAFNALLSGGSPTVLADQLTMLDALARNEQLRIKDVVQLKAQLDAERKPFDELVVRLTAQERELADMEKSINVDIKRLNDLRAQAYGSGQGTGVLKPVACPVEYSGGAAAKAAQTACNQIGKPYVFGTDGPGTFDCSGLTMYAWAQAGKPVLRHYTNWQYQDTKRVSRADLKAGDLVFYYKDMHHVGMYVGGGWTVHALQSGRPVLMKKIDDLPVTGYGRVA